jgi:hypothetical protein
VLTRIKAGSYDLLPEHVVGIESLDRRQYREARPEISIWDRLLTLTREYSWSGVEFLVGRQLAQEYLS